MEKNILHKNKKYLKSPMNYMGGKFRLLNQILPLFPQDINNFIDLFAGGCNVSINISANNIYCNDNLFYIIELYEYFKDTALTNILNEIETGIHKYQLSKTNEDGYKLLRTDYNTDKKPILFFLLICHSFNHQIRYNNSHNFTTPFGKERSQYNSTIEHNLINFIERIKEADFNFSKKDFREFDLSFITSRDLVYCDPPYLITTGSYNDGKRGFKGWGEEEETDLLNLLDKIDDQGGRFALSNVLHHKGKSNDILLNWVKDRNYFIHHLSMNYANSSYHVSNTGNRQSDEVLICNYNTK